MKRGSGLTPKGAKIVTAMARFLDAIKSGEPIEQRYTVRGNPETWCGWHVRMASRRKRGRLRRKFRAVGRFALSMQTIC
jgi:hypothetical protein